VFIPHPAGYRTFLPAALPPPDLDTRRLQPLASKAEIAIGRLDGIVEVIPDPDLFVFMYVRQEAVLSSQIEGTQASLMDVLEFEAEMARGEALVDVREIINYLDAMTYGIERMEALPISRRLLCEIHERLMRRVRGGEPSRTPGEFRRSQNWIGGSSPATARFVPPPHEEIGSAFGALERFLHENDHLSPLVRIGLAHAQFETIHPFLDGNGRIGRLLITLWLVEQKILCKPLLYLALHFKEHRDEYMDGLQAIRDDGAWEEWLEFFLEGVAQVAADAATRARKILALREESRANVLDHAGRGAPNALALLDFLFKQPVVTARLVQKVLDVSQPTASALVARLCHLGILQETTGRQRNRSYAFAPYLEFFPGANRRS
jgi:Fic family protein